jgi:hypothetical protein
MPVQMVVWGRACPGRKVSVPLGAAISFGCRSMKELRRSAPHKTICPLVTESMRESSSLLLLVVVFVPVRPRITIASVVERSVERIQIIPILSLGSRRKDVFRCRLRPVKISNIRTGRDRRTGAVSSGLTVDSFGAVTHLAVGPATCAQPFVLTDLSAPYSGPSRSRPAHAG